MSALSAGSKPLFTRFSSKDQVHFAKRLAFLLGAGVPILDSLHMLQEQAKSKHHQTIFRGLIQAVGNGQFLSSGMAKFEHNFGSFAVHITKIGERSGTLTENLNYLAAELQKRWELRNKVISALVYPVFICVATLLLAGGLTAFIFPKIMPIFSSLRMELPASTEFLLSMSEFLRMFGVYLILATIIGIVLFRLIVRYSSRFRFVAHRLVLSLPVFGRLLRYYYALSFCRTLGILLKSGVSLEEAVTITGETLGNNVYQAECLSLAEVVIRGDRMSQHIKTKPFLFPDMTSHLIAVGETAGTLSESLLYLSAIYESEIDDITKNLSSQIEPVLMIIMGLLVGFVAISVITPIYEVTQFLNA